MAAGVTYEPIATTALASAQSSITFSSLGSYTDIVMVCNFGTTSQGTGASLRFNSDSGSNYSTTQMNGPFPYGSSWRGTNQTYILIGSPIVFASPSTLTANAVINIQNYSSSNTYKTIVARSGFSPEEVVATTGGWRSNSAITSIQLLAGAGTTTFLSGSTFTIYGIQAA